jgi:hypothetical protein
MGNILLFQSKPFSLTPDALAEFAEQHHDSLSGKPTQVSI